MDAFGDKILHELVNSCLFPAISINNGCNMCSLCALFCPTDALFIKETEEGKGIVFKAATCVGCNLCVDVCAEKASNP